MTDSNEYMEPKQLDREGTFKAKALAWSVYEAKSKAVMVNVDFEPTAEWSGVDWASWADYLPHKVRGSFCVVAKDGTINEIGVNQLKPLGWNGQFSQFADLPPATEVQIVVKSEIYNGAETFKVSWVNPVDQIPGAPQGAASMDDLKKLDNRFGSLLRAAAAAGK